MKQFLVIVLLLFTFSEISAQYRFRTYRDTSKYNENSIDVKIFRTFNNINSKFIYSLVGISNVSIVPVSIAAPLGLYAVSRINENQYDESSSVLLALSELTSGIFTQATKLIVKRQRPFRTLNNVHLSDTNSISGTYSFPSGHSSASFAIATSITLRYPDNGFLIAGLYTYAAVVSLGRIYCGVHYPSDVFAGMIIGAGSAALIYSLRVPIIKGKNNLFNQRERTESYHSGNINTPAFLISLAAADFINSYFSNSKNKILSKSNINVSASSFNYSLNF